MRPALAVLAAIALARCGDSTGPALPAGAVITVFPPNIQLVPGDTLRFTATVTDSLRVPIPGVSVLWISSNPGVASVTQGGLVTSLAIGTARVIAAVDSASGFGTLMVVAPVDSIAVQPAGLFVVEGGDLQLTALMYDAQGNSITGRSAVWTTGNGAVATVDSTGLVTGIGPGVTTVTAGRDGATGNVTLSVRTVLFTSISASLFHHTCGVTNDQRGFCWGENSSGQTGTGVNAVRQRTPLGLPLPALATVSTGDAFACGLTPAGSALCWGEGHSGRLGAGDTLDHPTPTPVSGNFSFSGVAAGRDHACALTPAGAPFCWGFAFANGQTFPTSAPQPVTGGPVLATISAGGGFNCALAADSTAYCWGYNFDGELGDSTTTSRTTPAAVFGGRKFTALAARGQHVCAIAADSAAYCWGRTLQGELGTGDTASGHSLIPAAVAGGLKFTAISAGTLHTCGVAAGGAAYCWGYDGDGQLGAPATASCSQFACSPTPQAVLGGLSFSSISAGNTHTCGLTTGGIAYCWGTSAAGALGAGTLTQSATPVRVIGQP